MRPGGDDHRQPLLISAFDGTADDVVPVLLNTAVEKSLFESVGDDDQLVVGKQLLPDPIGLGAGQNALRRHLGETLLGHALEVQIGAAVGVPQPDRHGHGTLLGQ